MAITVFEKPTSRDSTLSMAKGSSIAYEIFALATAHENETQVIHAVLALTSYFYTGFEILVLKDIKVKARGGPYWEGTVTFGLRDGPTNGDQTQSSPTDEPSKDDGTALDNSFSFEVGGGTTHLVASLKTTGQYPAPGIVIPPTKNMIGIDKTKINGVDIHAPTFGFTCTQTFTKITLGYLKNLRYNVGSVNAKRFLSFPAGELLLQGVSGQYKSGITANPLGSWVLSFKFLVEQNHIAIKVGDIPPFAKLGWEYVWFGYADKYDAASGFTIQTPIYASVEKVYDYTDFKLLGFGF